MKSFAEDEFKAARASMDALEEYSSSARCPSDPNDERNVFLKMAGTGGDESALFSATSSACMRALPERNKWQLEMISESPGDMGGYKEVVASVIGQGAYSS